jgi:multimeric flavodoxin WrbA
MKVLGIKGSPRKRASSTALLEQVLAGAESVGADTETITPWKLDIGPCLACDACHQTGRCSVRDDFQAVYSQILDCDALVLATPIYFGAISAQLKPLIDRCESYWALTFKLEGGMPPGPAGRQRKGVLIATAGQDLDIMFVGPKITFGFLMRSLQGEVVAELLYGGLDEPGAIRRNREAMTRAFETGRRVALRLEPENSPMIVDSYIHCGSTTG